MSVIRAFCIPPLRKASLTCFVLATLAPSMSGAQANFNNISDDFAVFPVDKWSYAYADGSNTLLHVRIGAKDSLWNPDDLQLFVWQPQLEVLPKTDLSIGPPPLGTPAIPSSHNGNVSVVAVKRWTNNEMFIHYYDPSFTRLSWDDYFEFRRPDGVIDDFFIVVVEKKGTYITSGLQARGDESTFLTVETLTQDLGPGTVSAVMKLSRGRILLSVSQEEVFPCKHSCIYMVEFKKLSNAPLSIDGRVFFIPYGLMESALNKAGPGLRARYGAVRHIISLAKPTPLTTIGVFTPAADLVAH